MADADMAAAALFGVLGLITPLSDFSIASGGRAGFDRLHR
jgi:hypothetical protein